MVAVFCIFDTWYLVSGRKQGTKKYKKIRFICSIGTYEHCCCCCVIFRFLRTHVLGESIYSGVVADDCRNGRARRRHNYVVNIPG